VQLSRRAKVAFAARCVERVLPAIECQTAIQDHAAIVNSITASITFARGTSLGLATDSAIDHYTGIADKLRYGTGFRGLDLSVVEAADYARRAAAYADSSYSACSDVTEMAVSTAVAAGWAADTALSAVFSPEMPLLDLRSRAGRFLRDSEQSDLDWLKSPNNAGSISAQFLDRPLWSLSDHHEPCEADMPTIQIAHQLVHPMLLHCLAVIDNIFISYHHKDERYKLELETILDKLHWSSPVHHSHQARNVSVSAGCISDELPDSHIMRIIEERHITDSTLLIVLVGEETYCRKYVDWEIAAGLKAECAMQGLLLPTFIARYERSMNTKLIPARLLDLTLSGYAPLHTWDSWLNNRWHLLDDADSDGDMTPRHIEYSPIERAINDVVERFQSRIPTVTRPIYRRNRRPVS
jgi:hypothetical protein